MFLAKNRDFYGNSTDIETKILLEYHCFRSEMVSLWFLNPKTTSPLTQWLSTHSFGYCFSNLASTQSWADLARRGPFKDLSPRCVSEKCQDVRFCVSDWNLFFWVVFTQESDSKQFWKGIVLIWDPHLTEIPVTDQNQDCSSNSSSWDNPDSESQTHNMIYNIQQNIPDIKLFQKQNRSWC